MRISTGDPSGGGSSLIAYGTRLMSFSLLIYGISAIVGVTAIGLGLASVEPRDRLESSLDALYQVSLGMAYATAAIAAIAFAVMSLALAYIWRGQGKILEKKPWSLDVVQLTFAFGLLVLAVAIYSGIVIFMWPGTNEAEEAFGSYPWIGGAAALILLTIIAYTAMTLPGRSKDGMVSRLAIVATVGGAAGVVGETLTMAYPHPDVSQWASQWATAGGFPLLNFNLPFGGLVVASTFLLWFVYRSILGDLSGFDATRGASRKGQTSRDID